MEDVAVIVLGECMWGEEGGSALIYYTCTASCIYIGNYKSKHLVCEILYQKSIVDIN